MTQDLRVDRQTHRQTTATNKSQPMIMSYKFHERPTCPQSRRSRAGPSAQSTGPAPPQPKVCVTTVRDTPGPEMFVY